MTFGILLPALLLAAPPPPDAADLIARLKRPVPASTAYTEVRFVHQLTRPLILHGELDYGGADCTTTEVRKNALVTVAVKGAGTTPDERKATCRTDGAKLMSAALKAVG